MFRLKVLAAIFADFAEMSQVSFMIMILIYSIVTNINKALKQYDEAGNYAVATSLTPQLKSFMIKRKNGFPQNTICAEK